MIHLSIVKDLSRWNMSNQYSSTVLEQLQHLHLAAPEAIFSYLQLSLFIQPVDVHQIVEQGVCKSLLLRVFNLIAEGATSSHLVIGRLLFFNIFSTFGF